MLYQIYETTGVIGLILLSFAVIVISLFLAKLYQYWRLELWRTKTIKQGLTLLREKQFSAIKGLMMGKKHPVATMLLTLLNNNHQGNSREQIEQDIQQTGQQAINQIESHFRIFDVIANLSPLLGLLGTVLGMISAFSALQASGMQVDPSVLSGGISLALLTTAAGIAVAVPSIGILNYLESIAQQQRELLTLSAKQCLVALNTYGN